MNIVKSTARYENWLARHLRLIPEDLEKKHEAMRSAVFPFMRATYYRWAQVWAEHCPAEARAPKALAVGDLHVENFGTWRDIEGRLIWGINDFDEAEEMPYTNDLIRLAASALLAQVTCDPRKGLDTILKGYRDGLVAGGRPYALAERHSALRTMATHRLHEPEAFWEKLHALQDVEHDPPAGALKGIARMMPDRDLRWRIVHRVAGLGSLGRERYVAIAEWKSGSIAREAKALAPSACIWAEQRVGTGAIRYQEIIDRAVRVHDPFVKLQKRWIVRRLAPDCSRIELASLPKERDEMHLLHAMGFETANVHLGSANARALGKDLETRSRGWLYKAARTMEKVVTADWEAWASVKPA